MAREHNPDRTCRTLLSRTRAICTECRAHARAALLKQGRILAGWLKSEAENIEGRCAGRLSHGTVATSRSCRPMPAVTPDREEARQRADRPRQAERPSTRSWVRSGSAHRERRAHRREPDWYSSRRTGSPARERRYPRPRRERRHDDDHQEHLARDDGLHHDDGLLPHHLHGNDRPHDDHRTLLRRGPSILPGSLHNTLPQCSEEQGMTRAS